MPKIDPRISVGNILTFVVMICSVVYFTADVDGRVAAETAINIDQERRLRDVERATHVIPTQLNAINRQLSDIRKEFGK